MPGEGLPNGIAPLDSSSRVPPQNSQNVEDLESGLSIGEAVVGDGVGGLVGIEVPGSYYSQVEDNVTDTTSGGGFVNFLTLDTDSEDGDLPAGNYKISWHYVWQMSNTSGSINVVVALVAPGAGPNVDLNNPFGSAQAEYESTDSDNEHEVSGFRVVSLNVGRQIIELNFEQGDGGGTAAIHRGAIEIMRVPNP